MGCNDTEIIGIDRDSDIIILTIIILALLIYKTVFIQDLFLKKSYYIIIIDLQILPDPIFTKFSCMKFIDIV